MYSMTANRIIFDVKTIFVVFGLLRFRDGETLWGEFAAFGVGSVPGMICRLQYECELTRKQFTLLSKPLLFLLTIYTRFICELQNLKTAKK